MAFHIPPFNVAHIHPDGWRELAHSGVQVALRREIETLELLAAELSDRYTVYHGVHWSRVQQGEHLFGEIDFIIVNPAGQLLIIEQKSGLLEESDTGLVKRYGQTEKRVAVQLARNHDALLARLNRHLGQEKVAIDALLYCPDYTLKSPGGAGSDPARIVDADQRAHLAAVIRTALPEAVEPAPLAGKVHRFLRSELGLMPNVSAMVGESRVLYTRLSGGLAQWGRQIEVTPFRLRVVGTAGSGKTQLALAVLGDAIAAGRRPLYVCYNRPLADHIAHIAPPGVSVATYHQLADRLLRARGQTPDFTAAAPFQTLEAFMAEHRPNESERYDELIIDEGQDFLAEWVAPLLRLLRDDGRAWWLEDPMQNLYGRPPVDLPGWVRLTANTNYRSPKDILAYLNRLLDPASMVEAGSPFTGSEVEILTYATPGELMERTKTAITKALGAGFKKNTIALVTYRGREHSLFTPLDALGPHALRAFTGRYDLFGNPIYGEGELFIDSVYRFKGQSAPCVVFTEIDFKSLDERALKKFFVGMTRATLKLILVMSDRAAQALLQRLESGHA